MCFLSFHTPSFVSRTEKKEVTSLTEATSQNQSKKPVLTTIPVYTRGIYENLLRCIVIDGLQCIRCIFCKDGLFHHFYYFRCIIQIITGSMIKQA